jgi:hypothetical protein
MPSPRIGRSEERPSLDALWGRGKGEGELRHDLQRAGFLHAQGYRIVRAANEDVDRNLNGVLETILARLAGLPLILAFSPHAGRRDESGQGSSPGTATTIGRENGPHAKRCYC